MNTLDDYVKKPPSDQNAVDIFKDAWTSNFPVDKGLVAGPLALFDDDRIHWLVKQIGGVTNYRILELGPLEGAHTSMLERYGAQEILSIEANSGAYLRCLITKEILGMTKAKFRLGDLNAFMSSATDKFDLCVASGVLYHMQNPVWTLELLSQMSNRLFIWTHYYDRSICESKERFSKEPEVCQWRGLEVRQYRQHYGKAVNLSSFCGGSAEHSMWLEKDAIKQVLKQLGYSEIRENDLNPQHPNGPAVTLLALR